jgi:hypothetical protein
MMLMWWDWTQVTALDSVLFSLASTAVLYLVGSGFLRLISLLDKRSNLSESFDFLQRTNVRILFGFVFVFAGVFIFSLFNLSYLISSSVILGVAIIGFIAIRPHWKFESPNRSNLRNYLFVIIVLAILFATILLSSMLIKGYYGSTNDDGAEHTLITSILLSNPSSLVTRTSQLFYYPSGAHVLSSFLVTVLNVPVQKIVLMVSAIVPSLIALSFYSTTKSLFKSKIASVFASAIAAFLSVGLTFGSISWGGLPLLLSFYLSITSVGLILEIINRKATVVNCFFLGLIFFVASQTYPTALLIVSLWLGLLGIWKLSAKLHSRKLSIFHWGKINYLAIAAFLIPLLFSAPYFYSVYTHNVVDHQFSYLNTPVAVPADATKSLISFNWLFDIPALWFFFSAFGKLLAVSSISIFLIILLFIPQVSKRLESIFSSKTFSFNLLLVYLLILEILTYLALTLFLPINFLTVFINPERVYQHLFIPAVIITAAILFLVFNLSYLGFKRLLRNEERTILSRSRKNKLLACALLALMMFNVGLLSIPVLTEQQVSYKNSLLAFKTYETLGKDDLSLMKWMAQNTDSDAKILVSSGDSGQFVTAVTQRPTVSQYSNLVNYSNLMMLLTSNASDLSAVPLLIDYNVSYVYIGSIGTTYSLETFYYRQFNSSQLITVPYFTLAKQVGDAWLFEFNESLALDSYNEK